MSANPLKQVVRDAEQQELMQLAATFVPRCQVCGDRGFVGCPEAITPQGDRIGLAWSKGVACACRGAGAEFARMQFEWNR